jgi:hypothetical protein
MKSVLAALLALHLSLSAAERSPTKPALPWPAPDKEAAEKLRAELRGDFPEKFTFREVGPWLIVTDVDRDESERLISSTISYYAASIQRQLFTKTVLSKPVKVLLFKDAESYVSWNQKLYNEKPTTPFGYFSRNKHAMVMNIGTGGGTLVHEMVHAMAEADYPNIPAWLNEGLGSLYEASSQNSAGKVIGVTNWRLKGLLADLEKGAAMHYKNLIGIADNDFYGAHSGANYASMRYLMQWLQDLGKLEDFYTRVRDGKDASPQASLRALFDDKFSIEEIEDKVYAWVKTRK